MVIVRIPEFYGPDQALQNLEYVKWHWRNHKDDGRNKVGIISLSVNFWKVAETKPTTMNDEKALTRIKMRLAECIRSGLLPITSSGNEGGVSLPDEFTRLTATDRAR